MTTTLAPSAPLTAADRCDSCGATAYVRVVMNNGGELLFCAHHGRKNLDALKPLAKHIEDESHRLDPQPLPAE